MIIIVMNHVHFTGVTKTPRQAWHFDYEQTIWVKKIIFHSVGILLKN